jgi:hypothetical protein
MITKSGHRRGAGVEFYEKSGFSEDDVEKILDSFVESLVQDFILTVQDPVEEISSFEVTLSGERLVPELVRDRVRARFIKEGWLAWFVDSHVSGGLLRMRDPCTPDGHVINITFASRTPVSA